MRTISTFVTMFYVVLDVYRTMMIGFDTISIFVTIGGAVYLVFDSVYRAIIIEFDVSMNKMTA